MKLFTQIGLRRPAGRLVTLFAIASLGLAACDQGGGLLNPPEDNAVVSVTVSAPAQTVQSGNTLQLTATAWNASGTAISGKDFSWKSSDDAIATVSSSGVLTTHRDGAVTITATTENRSGNAVVQITAAPTPPSIALSGASVAFSATASQSNPAAQSVSITNAGGGAVTGLSPSITYAAGQPSGWLNASLSSTTAPATLTLQAATGTLPVGSYSATVTVRSSLAGVAERTVNVTFNVVAAPQPAIGLSPTSVAFSATAGQGNPAAQTVSVTNAGTGTLSGLSADISYAAGQPTGWLAATLSSTTAPATLTLQPNTANLLPGTYTATVVVRSSVAGVAERSVGVTLTVNPVLPVSPSAPSSLAASASGTQITLSWTDNSNNETEFRIERKTGAAGSYGQIGTVGANTTTYTDAGLSNGTTYFYRVRACNAGGCSAYSNEASATTAAAAIAPSVTTGSASAVTASSATLSGSVNPNGQATVAWFQWGSSTSLGNSTPQQSVGSGTTAQTITANLSGLTPGTTYYFRVVAQNSAGTATGSVQSFTTAQVAPAAPSNLAANKSGNQIRLTWRDNSNNETEFRIERKQGQGGSWSQIATVGANVTSYNDAPQKGPTFYYRVRACNSAGCSAYTNEADEKL